MKLRSPHARHFESSLPPEGAAPALGRPGGGPSAAYAIVQALIARGVIGDFRAGNGAAHKDILRFGFTPLYLSRTQVFDAVAHLREVLDTDEWRDERFAARGAVT